MAGIHSTYLSLSKYNNKGFILIQQSIKHPLPVGTCTTLMSESADFEKESFSAESSVITY